jgi:hypothetical protein
VFTRLTALMNYETSFGGFLYIFGDHRFSPIDHSTFSQAIPNCVLCFAFGRFWMGTLTLAGSIAGIAQ